MKKAFTLVEVMIVVAILGILAAIVLPLFQYNVTDAKESAAKDNLRILRNAIELYAALHDGIAPGYLNVAPNGVRLTTANKFLLQMIYYEHYLTKMPENPFNNKSTIQIIQDSSNLPTQATGTYGWIYKPSSKTIKLDWPGTDSKSTPYYDY